MSRSVPHSRRRSRRAAGYTLVEVMIALIMFAIITVATSLAVTSGVNARQAIQRHADDAQETRSVMRIMAQDLRAAHAAAGNPLTTFVATGDATGAVLTFTTLSHHVAFSDPANATGGGASMGTGDTQATPQSDMSTVQYYYDSDTHTLSRLESNVGGVDNLPQPGTPATVLSARVRSVSFQFMDAPTSTSATGGADSGTSGASSGAMSSATTSSGPRNEWSYNPDAMQQQSAGSATTAGTGSGSSAASSATTGDTALPGTVQITIEFDSLDGGPSETITTTVAIATPQPQPAGQTPATQSTTGTGGGTGAGGQNGGGGAGGGGGGGGTGGGGAPRPRPQQP